MKLLGMSIGVLLACAAWGQSIPATPIITTQMNECPGGGNLQGTVLGYSENRIRKAEVWVVGTEVAAKTDFGGHFNIQNLHPGVYNLGFSKKGFAPGKMEKVP